MSKPDQTRSSTSETNPCHGDIIKEYLDTLN